jgi:hypothetical protein
VSRRTVGDQDFSAKTAGRQPFAWSIGSMGDRSSHGQFRPGLSDQYTGYHNPDGRR